MTRLSLQKQTRDGTTTRSCISSTTTVAECAKITDGSVCYSSFCNAAYVPRTAAILLLTASAGALIVSRLRHRWCHSAV